MASNHTNLQAVNEQGQRVSLQHTTTDSPLLPAANLEQLKHVDPSLVGWVTHQTELEAAHRRKQDSRINLFIFLERISSIVAGSFVAIIGFLVAGYLVLQGHDWAGVTLGGTTLATIVTVIVTKEYRKKPDSAAQQKPRRSARAKK